MGRSGRLSGAGLLYRAAMHVAVPAVAGAMLLCGLRDASYRRNFRERFGFGAAAPRPSIWIHAVSVGEVQAAAPLVQALLQRHPDLPLVLTCFTPTGAARARALFAGRALVRYLPFDLPGSVRRFLRRAQPRVGVVFETELWPELYRACAHRSVPLVIASARLSERSVARYRRLGALLRETLAHVQIAAQAGADAERFRALGAEPQSTQVTGNIKFDLELPPDIAERGRALRSEYAPARSVWVAGSTHEGEEELLLEAHARLRTREQNALLVLAPRHPQRFDAVAERLRAAGTSFVRRSRHAPRELDAAVDVLLLDTLGELLAFYAAGDVAFVGGSLVPIGGHNLLEPAALGLPVLTGPHNFNAAELARRLIERGAARSVRDPHELADALAALLQDPAERERMGAAGREFVAGNRGALGRLLALIEPLLAN